MNDKFQLQDFRASWLTFQMVFTLKTASEEIVVAVMSPFACIWQRIHGKVTAAVYCAGLYIMQSTDK